MNFWNWTSSCLCAFQKKRLTCDLTSGMFIRASSVFDLALDLTSHSPAWCWGKKQWTKWIFVRLNCSHNPSTWNLTCNATELRLMPACPLVNVRRMEDMRRRLWLPSRPATDPDKEVIGPRLVKKRSDIWGLLDSCKKMVKNHCIHDRNLSLFLSCVIHYISTPYSYIVKPILHFYVILFFRD